MEMNKKKNKNKFEGYIKKINFALFKLLIFHIKYKLKNMF